MKAESNFKTAGTVMDRPGVFYQCDIFQLCSKIKIIARMLHKSSLKCYAGFE